MAEARGVFTLDRLRARVKKGTWVTPDEAFFAGSTESPNVGYYAGGQNPSQTPAIVSTVDKTNFVTDSTAVAPASSLAVNTQILGSLSSISAGYFGGGGNPSSPGSSSQVQKISYFSETVSISPGSNLTRARGYPVGCSNIQNGYFIGGYVFPTAYTTADKLSFSTDTPYFLPSALFIAERYGGASAGNQSVAYFAGGLGPSGNAYDSIIEKLTYATDTMERLPSDLSRRRVYPGGVGNEDAGFFAGGYSYTGAVPGPTTLTSDIDKLTYSNETISANPSNLSAATNVVGEAGNSTDGYYGGGNPGPRSTMDKITFSTGNVSAVPGAALSLARFGLAGVSPRSNEFPTTGFLDNTQNLKGEPQGPNAGYITTGNAGNSTINRTNYTTDVTFLIPATLTAARAYGSAVGSKTNIYFSTGTTSTITDRLTYATETSVRVPGANTIHDQYRGAAAENAQKTFGYLIMGGNPQTSNVEKIQYSTETYAAVPGAALNSRQHVYGSSGANNNGYAYAGYTGSGGVSEIQRTNFTTDTSQVLTTKLGATGWGACATGNSTDGYTSSVSGNTNVFRLNYATETSSTFSQLPASRNSGGGAGNQFNGYLSGGSPDPALKSNVDKIDYVTGVTLRLPSSAFLTFAQYGCTANTGFFKNSAYQQQTTPTLSTSDISSSPNTGYWGGGQGPISIVDKLNYSTEIMARVPGANLSDEKMGCAATGNSTAGYFGGGFAPGPSHFTTVDKLTYSSDSTGRLPSTNLSVARHSAAATSSSTAGYFGGGNNPGLSPGTQTRVDKLTYSDDTIAAVPGASLETGVFYVAANGTPSAGYWGAGRNPSFTPINVTTMQKILYSTDTSTTIPSGALTAARYGHASTGNSDVGYFMAGYSIGWFPTNGFVSTIDKITYSTETVSHVPGGTTGPRGFLDGTGSSSAGYISGGNTPGPDTTRTEKLTFTTETSIDLPGAQTTQAVWANAATSARANSVSATSNIL